MTEKSNKMISDFRGKPTTQRYYETVEAYVLSLGPSEKLVTQQVSFAIKRKFIWFWSYEQTADGMLYVTVRLDEKLDSPNFHYVDQVSANRWNHHVKVRSADIAESDWLKDLIRAGYEFAKR